MIKILVVEDSEIVRKGITKLLRAQGDMDVIGDASNGQEGLELIQKGLLPDIVLADLNMPGMNGIDLTRRIVGFQQNTIKVIVLTMHIKKSFINEALSAGAKGYIFKGGDFEELYDAIRQVHKGKTFVSSTTSGLHVTN